jgi:hypothetical protein
MIRSKQALLEMKTISNYYLRALDLEQVMEIRGLPTT